MPRRSDARRLIIPLALALLLVPGCAGAPPAPVPTPTHLDLGAEWGDDVGNGVTLLGTEDARAAVLSAMREQRGVSMQGTFTDAGGQTMTMSVSGRGGAVQAEFGVGAQTTSISIIDGVAYLLESPSTKTDDGEAGAYACLGTDDPAIARWRKLLDPIRTVADFTADASAIAPVDEATANLVLGDEGALGVLTVSADAEPLPIRLVRADAAGTMDVAFDEWGDAEVEQPSPLAEGC